MSALNPEFSTEWSVVKVMYMYLTVVSRSDGIFFPLKDPRRLLADAPLYIFTKSQQASRSNLVNFILTLFLLPASIVQAKFRLLV